MPLKLTTALAEARHLERRGLQVSPCVQTPSPRPKATGKHRCLSGGWHCPHGTTPLLAVGPLFSPLTVTLG